MGVFNAFYYNGVSSLEMGIRIERKNILNSPAPILKEYQIPGRNGTVFQFEGYENARVEYETFLKVPEERDIEIFVKSLKSWLLRSPGEYFRLEDDFDLEHYRMAAYTEGLEIDQSWKRFTRQTAVFSCKPFRYLKDGDMLLPGEMSESLEIYNPTEFCALPRISVYLGQQGVSSVEITVQYEDGESGVYNLTGIPASIRSTDITIDSDAQTVISSGMPGNQVVPSAVLTDFPVLKPGKNTVAVNASGISGWGIAPRWWEL